MKNKRGTGKIIDGDALEQGQADLLAAQMMDQVVGANVLVGHRIAYVRIHDNIGWNRRAIVIQCEDGTALRIAGTEMTVHEYKHGVTTEQLDREDEQMSIEAEHEEIEDDGA